MTALSDKTPEMKAKVIVDSWECTIPNMIPKIHINKLIASISEALKQAAQTTMPSEFPSEEEFYAWFRNAKDRTGIDVYFWLRDNTKPAERAASMKTIPDRDDLERKQENYTRSGIERASPALPSYASLVAYLEKNEDEMDLDFGWGSCAKASYDWLVAQMKGEK